MRGEGAVCDGQPCLVNEVREEGHGDYIEGEGEGGRDKGKAKGNVGGGDRQKVR